MYEPDNPMKPFNYDEGKDFSEVKLPKRQPYKDKKYGLYTESEFYALAKKSNDKFPIDVYKESLLDTKCVVMTSGDPEYLVTKKGKYYGFTLTKDTLLCELQASMEVWKEVMGR